VELEIVGLALEQPKRSFVQFRRPASVNGAREASFAVTDDDAANRTVP
jgi:hypothetical protein